MNAIPLTAVSREAFGKGPARKLRRDGRVPALVYALGGDPTHISVDPHELKLIFQKSGNPNTLLSVDVGGATRTVLVKASQKHPVSRSLVHVDFYEVQADRDVVVEVPIKVLGRSKGEKLGGRLQMLRLTVPVRAKPGNIPATVETNVDNLEVGEFVLASQLTSPEGAVMVYEHDFNVLVCIGKRIVEEDEEEAETEGEEGEKAAESSE